MNTLVRVLGILLEKVHILFSSKALTVYAKATVELFAQINFRLDFISTAKFMIKHTGLICYISHLSFCHSISFTMILTTLFSVVAVERGREDNRQIN